MGSPPPSLMHAIKRHLPLPTAGMHTPEGVGGHLPKQPQTLPASPALELTFCSKVAAMQASQPLCHVSSLSLHMGGYHLLAHLPHRRPRALQQKENKYMLWRLPLERQRNIPGGRGKKVKSVAAFLSGRSSTRRQLRRGGFQLHLRGSLQACAHHTPRRRTLTHKIWWEHHPCLGTSCFPSFLETSRHDGRHEHEKRRYAPGRHGAGNSL